jgi:hypothetical protein
MMSRLRKPGIGVVVGLATGVAGSLIPATPVAAHQTQQGSPGGAGTVTVSPGHYGSFVCSFGLPVTGEFLMSTLVTQRRTAVGRCSFDDTGEEILRYRACDFAGCSAWKYT